jgi:hypothetical protein
MIEGACVRAAESCPAPDSGSGGRHRVNTRYCIDVTRSKPGMEMFARLLVTCRLPIGDVTRSTPCLTRL